ncbi:MAG TPA: peptide-methionine (S)-S-oxide reductase MsrA [Methylophilaceae bacterium]|jgi:peptide-methionine (S)-S-oxide reductase
MNKSKLETKTIWKKALRAACMLGIGMLLGQGVACSSESAVAIPAPTTDEHAAANVHSETLVLSGGCFWGVQGVFQHVRGVTSAVSGYAGGRRETATYDQVSEGNTGHAESVQVTYDPNQITYGQLLQIFFSVVHNPTELNYQGPDSGTQYRSALFPTNDMQKQVAQGYIAQLDRTKAFHAPIVTHVETYTGFYPAEDHHQDFLTLNPHYPYIMINDLPKVEALKRMYPNLYRTQPVLVKATSH